jgi:hypothetical protein
LNIGPEDRCWKLVPAAVRLSAVWGAGPTRTANEKSEAAMFMPRQFGLRLRLTTNTLLWMLGRRFAALFFMPQT